MKKTIYTDTVERMEVLELRVNDTTISNKEIFLTIGKARHLLANVEEYLTHTEYMTLLDTVNRIEKDGESLMVASKFKNMSVKQWANLMDLIEKDKVKYYSSEEKYGHGDTYKKFKEEHGAINCYHFDGIYYFISL